MFSRDTQRRARAFSAALAVLAVMVLIAACKGGTMKPAPPAARLTARAGRACSEAGHGRRQKVGRLLARAIHGSSLITSAAILLLGLPEAGIAASGCNELTCRRSLNRGRPRAAHHRQKDRGRRCFAGSLLAMLWPAISCPPAASRSRLAPGILDERHGAIVRGLSRPTPHSRAAGVRLAARNGRRGSPRSSPARMRATGL